MAVKLDLQQVEDLAAQGLTLEEISSSLGINPSTLYRKKKQMRELQDALKRGQSKGIAQVANALFSAALDGNTSAMIFYLKTRAGWKEKQTIELEGGDKPIKVQDLTPESAKRLSLEQLQRLAVAQLP